MQTPNNETVVIRRSRESQEELQALNSMERTLIDQLAAIAKRREMVMAQSRVHRVMRGGGKVAAAGFVWLLMEGSALGTQWGW